MKLLFSFVFLFIGLASPEAKEVEKNYTVKTKGITIGNLNWQIKLEQDTYTTSIDLKSKGPLSLVYKFKGYYETSGIIKNNILIPGKYVQEWKTKNKQRNIHLIFQKNKIMDLKIQPEEKELARINFSNYLQKLKNYLYKLYEQSISFSGTSRRPWSSN